MVLGAVGDNINTGSYAINGWLYTLKGADQWVTDPTQQTYFFQQESAIGHSSLTPTFMDAMWPDLWPLITDVPPTDLTGANANNILGRCCIARHPLTPNAKVVSRQVLPSGINMGFADGSARLQKLRDIKNVYWHQKFTPNANSWAVSP